MALAPGAFPTPSCAARLPNGHVLHFVFHQRRGTPLAERPALAAGCHRHARSGATSAALHRPAGVESVQPGNYPLPEFFLVRRNRRPCIADSILPRRACSSRRLDSSRRPDYRRGVPGDDEVGLLGCREPSSGGGRGVPRRERRREPAGVAHDDPLVPYLHDDDGGGGHPRTQRTGRFASARSISDMRSVNIQFKSASGLSTTM